MVSHAQCAVGDHDGRRTGIATEALGGVVECAFDFFGLNVVRASVLQPNLASIRVLEKADFRRGGEVVLQGGKPAFWYLLGRAETGRALITGWWRHLGYWWLRIRLAL